MSTSTDTEALLCAIAAFDLPGIGRPGGIELATTTLSSAAWRDVLAAVQRHRLEGVLAWSLATDAWTVTDTQLAQAYDAHRRAMSLTLLLERELVELSEAFAGRGIPVRVLKGSALARLDEPDPSRRSFGDVDLLVRAQDIEAADALLSARGGERRFAEPRPGFDRRFSKGSSYTFPHNSEVDLHRTLVAGPFGMTIDLDDLFAHTEPFSIVGHELLALDRPSRFIHACVHAVLGSARPRISALRDLVHTAPGSAAELHVVVDRSERWQSDAVVALAVRTARERFDWTPPDELRSWATGHQASGRAQRWLTGYVGGNRSYARQMIDGLQAVSGAGDKVAYALAITLPAPSPGRTPTAERLRRGLRALRQTIR